MGVPSNKALPRHRPTVEPGQCGAASLDQWHHAGLVGQAKGGGNMGPTQFGRATVGQSLTQNEGGQRFVAALLMLARGESCRQSRAARNPSAPLFAQATFARGS